MISVLGLDPGTHNPPKKPRPSERRAGALSNLQRRRLGIHLRFEREFLDEVAAGFDDVAYELGTVLKSSPCCYPDYPLSHHAAKLDL
jgi:hypothetical protein